MEDWAHPGARAELPPRSWFFQWRYPRSNANRRRCPPQGPQRQLHPGRRFSTQIHTWRIAWLAYKQ